MLDERRQPIPADMVRNEDGTQTVNYTPRSIGTFTASVAYGPPDGAPAAAGPSSGGPVPGSPFSVAVHPDVDVSKIYVEGLEPSAYPTIVHRISCSLCSRTILHSILHCTVQ